MPPWTVKDLCSTPVSSVLTLDFGVRFFGATSAPFSNALKKLGLKEKA